MSHGAFSLNAALDAVRRRLSLEPEIFIVLGSGLGALADEVGNPVVIPFDEVPGFPQVGVEGHLGCLVGGTLEGRRVLIQAGRFHFYEGHPPEVVVAPVRVAAGLGVKTTFLTNAAGGIRQELSPGSILLLDDHLNLMGRGPLVGPVQEGEERFPDMSTPYDAALREKAMELAEAQGIPLFPGVYAGVLGPSYETPAEIRFLEGAGADAVGMSTVPEVITARALGLRVVAFSLITNRASGLAPAPLSHQEVLEVGREGGGKLRKLIRALIREMPLM